MGETTGKRPPDGPKESRTPKRFHQFTIFLKPVSANDQWRQGKSRPYLSPEAREFKKAVGWEAKAAGVTLWEGDVHLQIYYYHRDPERRLDCSNVVKVLEDGLKGVAFVDDKQVRYVSSERWHDHDNPRVTVFLTYF